MRANELHHLHVVEESVHAAALGTVPQDAAAEHFDGRRRVALAAERVRRLLHGDFCRLDARWRQRRVRSIEHHVVCSSK